MTKLLIALLTITAINPAFASEQVETTDKCKVVEQLSRTIMTARQKGMSLVKVRDLMQGDALATNIVDIAYSKPRMMVESNQQRAINNFADNIYLICLKAKK